jgi:dihydrofolate synthase / folylpolyglutamate synthase
LNCPAVWVKPSRDLGDGWAEYCGAEYCGAIYSDSWGAAGEVTGESFRYPLPLLGIHQLTNSALAIATLNLLRQQGWQITDAAIESGMAKTRWAGRMQWDEWQGQKILIDGAHNPAGAAALREYLDRESIALPIHWVMGMIANKDHAEVFQALFRPGDFVYLVPVPDHIPVDLAELAALAWQACPELQHCETYGDVMAGLAAAKQTKSNNATIVLCGSLYLIGYFFKLTGRLDRQADP